MIQPLVSRTDSVGYQCIVIDLRNSRVGVGDASHHEGRELRSSS
jgi:hypothetical protein